ncbi:glycosyltransferase family 9 protein [Emticicia sp. TH156]|uniref:glycosyltransferase family 9 protein n=1 Tax=Emticicia sp. TH156 TaxID=2067454 RepID=UPI000C77C029|nr:glycosyltransferase family 9 protein [Emticicia sp. TH156]PLK42483.1 LPS biosynthesis glycosyltransferase [Emticicia sp. TH156]
MKIHPANVKKIAILRALQLGDLLCSVPAFRALRHAYPAAEITLLGLPWAAAFVDRFSMYIDKFVHFPGYEGLPEQAFDQDKWATFMQLMKEKRFDLVLQMQGKGTIVNEMLQAMSLPLVSGFHCDESTVNSDLFVKYPEGISEIDRHLALMQHLEIPLHGKGLEFPVYAADMAEWENKILPLLPEKYVCVHAGSRGEWRQWPTPYFALVADYCAEHGYEVVITGTKEESPITQQVIYFMKNQPIDMTGKTSLGTIGLLIKNASILISNCTGVSHIASATRTPSVVISMDGEPERWAPLDKAIHRVIDWPR